MQEIQKKIEEARAEAEVLEAQHAELHRQCEAVEEQCKEFKRAQVRDEADIVKINEQRCQVGHQHYAMMHFHTSVLTKQALVVPKVDMLLHKDQLSSWA